MAKIKIEPKDGKIIEYYMDDHLKKNLDAKVIPSLQKKDKDCVLVVDGLEGSGKSTLAFQIGRHVDPTLNLKRITFDPVGFREAIFKAKKGQCVIYDEAFTGLSSRTSLSAINNALVSLMMQMRQKNLFVILVLPTFFLLDRYPALFRTKALIHVYENKGVRGYFRLYNSKLKKYLYLFGKQTFSYGSKNSKHHVFTKFKGRFYGVFALGDENTEKEYRKKKAKALEETQKNPMSAGQVKYREQRDIILFLLRKTTKMTYQEIENLFLDYDLEMSYVQIRNICVKFGDKPEKTIKINGKKDIEKENLQKIDKNEEIVEKNELIDEKEPDSE